MLVRELHFHSMVVHSVIAFAFVGAGTYALDALGVTIGSAGPATWAFLWRASLVLTALTAVPAAWSGVTERGHMYVNWAPSHRVKLVLSLALVAAVAMQLAGMLRAGDSVLLDSWLGLGMLVVNPLLCLALSAYGLRITLGRQSFARTSYVADMDQHPVVDVTEAAARHAGEPVRLAEVMERAV